MGRVFVQIRKEDLDAIRGTIKPVKKVYCVATYLNKYRVEVKLKAEAFYESVKDSNKTEVFNKMISSSYTILKQVAYNTHFELLKSTKKEILKEGSIQESAINLILEYRTTWVINGDVSAVQKVYSDASAEEIELGSDSGDISKVLEVLPHRRKSPTPPKSPSSSSSSHKKHSPHSHHWVLPNRTGFTKWLYKTFGREKYMEATASDSPDGKNNVKFFPQQRLVRDFMQFNSPYRGIMLYHGLGVGKTCASIAAAEGFLQRHKKVFVLVPASIAQNYKNEILRCSSVGNPQHKIWNIAQLPQNKDHPAVKRVMEVYGYPYELIKKHHSRLWLPHIADGVPFTRRHVSWASLNEAERGNLYDFMQDYIETKYTFISYNGITENGIKALGTSPFDDAFIVMDEAHNFISRVTNGGKIASKLFKMIMNSKRSKMIFLSGTPIINHPFELSVLLNLVRGPTRIYRYKFGKDVATLPTVDDIKAVLKRGDKMKYVDNIVVSTKDRMLSVQYLPVNFVRVDNEGYDIKHEEWAVDEQAMNKVVRDIISAKYKISKKEVIDEAFSLPDSKSDFEKLFLDETDRNNPLVKNEDLFMRRILGLVSYYKTVGEEYFPSMLAPVQERIPLTDYQFSNYLKMREKERKMEDFKKRRRQDAVTGLFSKKGSTYRAFSRMSCNFVFPEDIQRPFPSNIRKQLEREISQNDGDARENDAGAEAEETEQINLRVQKEYEKNLKDAMNALREPDGPLVLQKLQDMYSPKFAAITKDILESPGSCLLYSQFRTVEGLGIMRFVLEQAGFAEIQVERKANEWVLVDEERVLGAEFNGKRFVVFNEDRDKTNLLIKIFNGMLDDIPASLSKPIKAAGFSNNLRGDLARLIMISQSGAEGISLRNVRRVMITEPFWNKVRIDQVIGRAVRAGSHLDLPLDERNVQVFTYMAVLTPEQLASNFTIQRLDDGQTSDEHINDIATRKSRIIDQFLQMTKRAAFDCTVNAGKNGMMTSGMQCYAFPINQDDSHLAFLPTLKEEKIALSKKKMERTTRIQGRVVKQNGKKYVAIEGKTGLYDYKAYKDAGVLLPA